jgi:DNA-binding CsgD family transcriptional regulator
MLDVSQLTDIERTLLRMLSTGASNKEIALKMFKSEQTIRNQLSTLFKKINASNRTQAACWYRDKEHVNSGIFGTSVLLPASLTSANNASLTEADVRHQHSPKDSL